MPLPGSWSTRRRTGAPRALRVPVHLRARNALLPEDGLVNVFSPFRSLQRSHLFCAIFPDHLPTDSVLPILS